MINIGSNAMSRYPYLDKKHVMVEESLIHWVIRERFIDALHEILKMDRESVMYLRNMQTPLDYCRELQYQYQDVNFKKDEKLAKIERII